MTRRLVLVLVLAVLPVAGWPADPSVLRVGMDTRTPPWAYVPGLDYSKEDAKADPVVSEAQLKKVVGLDVDVANDLARRMGAAGVKIVPVSWFGAEQGLLARRYDVIIASWTPSKKTPPAIAASQPYYEWGLQIAVRSDDKRIQAYSDLAGLPIGYYDDTVAERTVRSLGAGTLVPRDSQEALFDDLKAGKVRAVLFDSLYVRWRVANDPAFRAVGEPLNKLGYHVGVLKEDAALLGKVEAAVKSLLASGDMEPIRRRWEGAAAK